MSLTIKAVQNGINDTDNLKQGTVQKQTANKGKSIFAGRIPVATKADSLVQEKRKSVQKQAMRLVSDAWGKDQRASQKIDDKRQLRQTMLSRIEETKERLKEFDDAKARLQEQYEIDPESQEQKDLELLEKYQDYLKGLGTSDFSEEEVDRLEELQYMPRTQYQVDVLKLNEEAGQEKKNIQKMDWQEKALKQSIANDKIEQVKSQDMLNANEAKEQIMDAASKDIMNLLVQESKDNMDEKVEEEQEKAEQAEEKQEEQQERIDKTKENRKDQQEIIEGELKSDKLEMEASFKQQSTGEMEHAQKNIQKILKENNLINEDLKGIEIDFGF
ncbi:MAG: hypothetical protein HFI71_13690 [Lachnospiraceae bacterium]|nr:hypothetical protein [Lachnospiraceae bacterium]